MYTNPHPFSFTENPFIWNVDNMYIYVPNIAPRLLFAIRPMRIQANIFMIFAEKKLELR